MQSFAPLYTPEDCANVLDRQRLFKNALEAYQCLNVIRGDGSRKGWSNHPVVKMWAKNANAYVEYALCFLDEWEKRGYKTTIREKIKNHYRIGESKLMPAWWGREEFHASHRGTLKFKNNLFYSKYNWPEPAKYEYWWPTQHGY